MQCGISESTDSLKHESSLNFLPTLGALTLHLTLKFLVLTIGWDFE